MLNNHRRVRDQWPEVVGKKSRISLEVREERRRISVVVRIFSNDQTSLPIFVMGVSDFMYKTVSPIAAFSRPHSDDDCCDSGFRPCHVFDDTRLIE